MSDDDINDVGELDEPDNGAILFVFGLAFFLIGVATGYGIWG